MITSIPMVSTQYTIPVATKASKYFQLELAKILAVPVISCRETKYARDDACSTLMMLAEKFGMQITRTYGMMIRRITIHWVMPME